MHVFLDASPRGICHPMERKDKVTLPKEYPRFLSQKRASGFLGKALKAQKGRDPGIRETAVPQKMGNH